LNNSIGERMEMLCTSFNYRFFWITRYGLKSVAHIVADISKAERNYLFVSDAHERVAYKQYGFSVGHWMSSKELKTVTAYMKRTY